MTPAVYSLTDALRFRSILFSSLCQAHAEALIYRRFTSVLDSSVSRPLKRLLRTIVVLYGLWRIEQNAAVFMEVSKACHWTLKRTLVMDTQAQEHSLGFGSVTCQQVMIVHAKIVILAVALEIAKHLTHSLMCMQRLVPRGEGRGGGGKRLTMPILPPL